MNSERVFEHRYQFGTRVRAPCRRAKRPALKQIHDGELPLWMGLSALDDYCGPVHMYFLAIRSQLCLFRQALAWQDAVKCQAAAWRPIDPR